MALPAPAVQSSEINWDGKGIFELQIPRTVFGTGAQTQYLGVAPCDAELIWAQVRVLASAVGASAKINLGLNAVASGLLRFKSLQGVLASTVVNLLTATSWVSREVRKGDLISLQAQRVSSANQGSFAGVLVFRPRG